MNLVGNPVERLNVRRKGSVCAGSPGRFALPAGARFKGNSAILCYDGFLFL